MGNFEEIGPGVYTDGNGSYYVDDDGDGIIDYEAGYVEDDYPEEPDPPVTPAPDSDTGEEGDELPNEEGPQDDNEYNTISLLLDISMNAVYIRKSRMRNLIKEMSPAHMEQFLEVLH